MAATIMAFKSSVCSNGPQIAHTPDSGLASLPGLTGGSVCVGVVVVGGGHL